MVMADILGNKVRLSWLDALKGVGILSIMRIHMVVPMELLQSILYVGAVAMFFVSAGFNFKYPINVKDAVVLKAKRLLIPYLFYSLLLMVVEHRPTIEQIEGVFYGRMSLYQGAHPGNITFLLIGNAPMWFLPCMFLSYVWIYTFYCRCRTVLQKLLVVLAFILVSSGLYFSPVMLPWSLDTSFLLASLLIAGYELKSHFMHTRWRHFLFAFVVWISLYRFFSGSNISVGSYGAYGVLSIIPFTFIAMAETYSLSAILQFFERTWLVKLLAYVGRRSLRLMCMHLIIYTKVNAILNSYLPTVHGNKWMLLFISFFFIFAVNACIDIILKRFRTQIKWYKYL